MADLIFKSLLSLALLVSFFLCSSLADASSDVPFILAHKKAALNRLKSGVERVLVTIDIYNQGSTTAYDVSLADDSWPNDTFNIISGSTSKTWERLDAGGILSHTFELEATQKGVYSGEPAVIKFRIPTKAALQEAFSTPILPLDVLADITPEKKLDWAKRLFAKYGSLISVVSIVVLFVYLVVTPSKSSAKASKKRR